MIINDKFVIIFGNVFFHFIIALEQWHIALLIVDILIIVRAGFFISNKEKIFYV